MALQEIGLDPLMKSVELLVIQGRLFGLTRRQARERAMELLQLVKLDDVLDRPVSKYSGGMRRRLDLAMALAHQPEILFLDEPTTGLDPASRRDIWNEIRRLDRELGMTIFLTTQYLEEADKLADRIAIINHGKIAIEGTPEALKSALGSRLMSLSVTTRRYNAPCPKSATWPSECKSTGKRCASTSHMQPRSCLRSCAGYRTVDCNLKR